MKIFLLLAALMLAIPAVSSPQTPQLSLLKNHPEILRDEMKRAVSDKSSALKKFLRSQRTGIVDRDYADYHLPPLTNIKVVVNCDDARRFSYIYDNSENLIEDLFEMQTDGIWENMYKSTYKHDNAGNCITEIDEVWENGAWSLDGKYSFTYDGAGCVLTEVSELVLDSLLTNNTRNIYTYDASGNLGELLMGYWSDINNDWLYDVKRTYTYDHSGNCLVDLEQLWSDSSGWQNLYRYTNTYDNSGNCLTSLTEFWLDNNWINNYRYTGTYSSTGKTLSWSSERWKENIWENLDKSTYQYDNSGNCLSDNYDMWYYNNWANYQRYIYSFDSNNNMLTSLYQQPEYVGQQPVNWINGKRCSYSYDITGRIIQGDSYSWKDSLWIPFDDYLTVLFDINLGNYRFVASHLNVTYTEIPTGVGEKNINPVSFSLEQNYPNPFNPSTRIQYAVGSVSVGNNTKSSEQLVTLKVYDILGKEVAILVNEYKAPGNYEVEFNGSNLATGVYIYKLQAGNFTHAKKLVLMK